MIVADQLEHLENYLLVLHKVTNFSTSSEPNDGFIKSENVSNLATALLFEIPQKLQSYPQSPRHVLSKLCETAKAYIAKILNFTYPVTEHDAFILAYIDAIAAPKQSMQD